MSKRKDEEERKKVRDVRKRIGDIRMQCIRVEGRRIKERREESKVENKSCGDKEELKEMIKMMKRTVTGWRR